MNFMGATDSHLYVSWYLIDISNKYKLETYMVAFNVLEK